MDAVPSTILANEISTFASFERIYLRSGTGTENVRESIRKVKPSKLANKVGLDGDPMVEPAEVGIGPRMGSITRVRPCGSVGRATAPASSTFFVDTGGWGSKTRR